MDTITRLRSEFVADLNDLIERRAATTDAGVKSEIDATIAGINLRLQALDQMNLLQAAMALSDTTAELERIVKSARTSLLDGLAARIGQAVARLQDIQGDMHASEALPSANEPPPAASPAPPPAGAPINSTDFAVLKAEYRRLYDNCTVRPESRPNVEYYKKQLERNRPAYEAAASGLGTIPWHFIGIVHAMECGFKFSGHLHNGDPLTARTVQVPAGRPAAGNPPFDWKTSARDAMQFKGYDKETDWSVERTLYLLEKYNGFGYRPRGVPSPYLWSFSNQYTKGRFVADHKFDPNAVSKQCGTALMMKGLGVA